jgi:hypothetical protein
MLTDPSSMRLRVARVMDRARLPKLLHAVLLFALGAAAILYGILALAYRGDGSTVSYVTLAMHRLDAHLAGATSVALGVTLAVCGWLISVGAAEGSDLDEPTDQAMT